MRMGLAMSNQHHVPDDNAVYQTCLIHFKIILPASNRVTESLSSWVTHSGGEYKHTTMIEQVIEGWMSLSIRVMKRLEAFGKILMLPCQPMIDSPTWTLIISSLSLQRAQEENAMIFPRQSGEKFQTYNLNKSFKLENLGSYTKGYRSTKGNTLLGCGGRYGVIKRIFSSLCYSNKKWTLYTAGDTHCLTDWTRMMIRIL